MQTRLFGKTSIPDKEMLYSKSLIIPIWCFYTHLSFVRWHHYFSNAKSTNSLSLNVTYQSRATLSSLSRWCSLPRSLQLNQHIWTPVVDNLDWGQSVKSIIPKSENVFFLHQTFPLLSCADCAPDLWRDWCGYFWLRQILYFFISSALIGHTTLLLLQGLVQQYRHIQRGGPIFKCKGTHIEWLTYTY